MTIKVDPSWDVVGFSYYENWEMPFGQLVIGPPGSGKTTYCNGMHQFLNAINRKTIIVNLDPANDVLPYTPTINILDLVDLSEVMEKMKLGPNGEYLEVNIDWLIEQIDPHKDCYVLFDCPGQVELYSHHDSFHKIVKKLESQFAFRLAAVHLIDSFYCSQPTVYISALLTSLIAMLKLELPHINILSKIDQVLSLGELDFNLEFYTDVLDLHYLVDLLDKVLFAIQFQFLKVICDLVQDFQLVCFHPLAIEDKESVYKIVKTVDKANGYIYGGLSEGNECILDLIHSNPLNSDWIADVQEKYVDGFDS